MQMISSNRANVVPPLLLSACIILIGVRFASIIYDIYAAPPAVNLVKWDEFKRFDKNAPNLADKPYLVYFIDSSDLFSKLKGEAFEGFVLKNREVARQMNQNFRCVKCDLSEKGKTDKEKEDIEKIQKEYVIGSTPDVVAVMPNGRAINYSSMQLTDRLFYYALEEALQKRYKLAGDIYMQRGDFANAYDAYGKYLALRTSDDDARAHAVVRYYFACRLTGHDDDARTALSDPVAKSSESEWGAVQCVKYLRGEVDADDFAVYCKDNTATGKYVLGMKLLLDGKKDEAITNLRTAAERGVPDNPDTLIARAELKKLGVQVRLDPEQQEEDPTSTSTYTLYD